MRGLLAGDEVTYRGRVIQWEGGMKWLPPELDGDLTWGALRPGLKRGHRPARVGKAPLQKLEQPGHRGVLVLAERDRQQGSELGQLSW